MAKPKKRSRKRSSPKPKAAKIERDIAKIMAAVSQPELAAPKRPTSATAHQSKLDRDLPWRHSYANWCAHLGIASAKYNARIEYGADTYEAWESGTSPDAYARAHARR